MIPHNIYGNKQRINKEMDFLKSTFVLENPFMPTEKFLQWLHEKRTNTICEIRKIPLSKMRKWNFDEYTKNIVHESGKFFSIEGIKVETNWGKVPLWTQPIINQPEVGFLGIICKNIDGILYFLMQAKIEPGNINLVQLSPTLQATRSNYSKVHKGNTPHYLEYFNGERSVKVLFDQLQSEQGARFLKKRNRNMIVEVNEKIELLDDFCWLTLGQIKHFMQYDNIINMDTRTVISGIPFGDYPKEVLDLYGILKSDHSISNPHEINLLISMLDRDNYLHSIEDIISWITQLKSIYDLNVEKIPLNDVKKWVLSDEIIYHENNKYFSVIGVNISIGNREVQTWDQPLVEAAQEGLIAFLIKKINGVYHFLVQAKLEAGNFDIIELAPTVQCLTGNYRQGYNEYDVPFVDVVLEADKEQIWYSAYQSEEGGRFYEEQNKNLIIEVDDKFDIDVPGNYIWMTLNQLTIFMKFNNYLNIAARSLIAAVKFN
jgi:oxidase EvaA